MKKFIFILVAFISFSVFGQGTQVLPDTNKAPIYVATTDTIDVGTVVVANEVKNQIIIEAKELLKDSVFRSELYAEGKQIYENKPEAETDFWTWFIYILSGLLTLIGMFISKMPTTSSMWYLQPIQAVIRFILNNILAPKNVSKDGGEHKI